MKLLIMSIALLAVAGVFLLRRLARLRMRRDGDAKVSIVIIVKDQEHWIEGFVRKLFIQIKNIPRAKVFFINDGSSDKTSEVLNCLQKYYPFELLSAAGDKPEINMMNLVDANKLFPVLVKFDVRGLKEKDLLNAPLFSHLTRFYAGKSFILSK
ncbi:MAG: hypothetical protein A4E53_02196 [Pelotomaculum sp. PtaB.Bin104]|nr:MAG: hypothetical protein A4E53_02196 [Pelotomaculum sp. PtaB.Bin104]